MKRDFKIKMGSNRSFGLVFFVVFLIIAFWTFRGDFSEIKIIPLLLSLAFLILGLINSKLLHPLNKIWFRLGLLLGSIIAPLVMGIVFFAVVTPTSFLVKLMGKDLLKNRYDKNKKSYWIKRDKSVGTMKKQF
tara:strand:+ start:4018 stop:4416 length:399 start_codon:yes stop_codon:yes gene_type:complete